MRWTRKENWLFLFAAIGAVAALTRILEYVNISPFKAAVSGAPVTPTPVPNAPAHDVSALLWGIGLFLFSFGLSVYGLLRKPKRLEIVNMWDRDAVTFKQDVIGITSDPMLPIELRVLADGVWYRQWPVKIEGTKWRGKCQFGNEESLSKSGDYHVVAISPKQDLPDKITDLPKDTLASTIIAVHRAASQPSAEAEVLRVTMQLNAEIDKRDLEISDLQSSLEAVEERNKTILGLETRLEKCEKDQTARAESDAFRHSISMFKARARLIRRTWPNSDFVKHPMALHSWVPAAYSSAPPWMRLASEWHSAVSKIQHVSNVPLIVLNILTFDDVMELLDDAQVVQYGGKPFSDLTGAKGLPEVWITRWGTDESSSSAFKTGFFIKNTGEQASNVHIFPEVPLGEDALSSLLPVKLLLKQHHEVFMPVLLGHDNQGTVVSSNTVSSLIAALSPNANGTPAPVLIRVVYMTADGSWIGSTHQFQVSPGGLIEVIPLMRELLIGPMPQLEIADSLG